MVQERDGAETRARRQACRGLPAVSLLIGCRVAGVRRDDFRMRLELAGVEVRAEDWVETCGCTIENASGLRGHGRITVVPSRRLGLVSAYVADLDGEIAVTHMRLAPTGRRATFEQQVLAGLPGVSRPRACLLDHAVELRRGMEELLDAPVSVEIPEPTLEHASRVWRQSGGIA